MSQRQIASRLILTCCLAALVHSGEAQDAVCSGGFGSFKSGFATGVTVSVGSVHKSEFAARACRANLDWQKQNLQVEPAAYQVDVDAMGIDLGLGSPVVAFQIQRTDIDRLATYKIYSLKTPPRELRTISGGDDYSAADTDLDGRIEIWTHDAAAVSGFENIPLHALDFPPVIVLRFEQKKLIEVSSEFVSEFDRQITALRTQLNSQDLKEFKSSNGTLSTTSFVPPDELHRLITTKTKVLEIVWAYVYSGREPEAWKALSDMWPPSDLERIRAAILRARAQGIRSQVDGVSERPPDSFRKKKKVMIYDRISEADASQGNPLSWDYTPGASGPTKTEHTFEADSFPIPILLRRSPPAETSTAALRTEVTVNLVIDAAGKVRSANAVGNADEDLLRYTENWKFIPAFKNGRPVASRLQTSVVPTQ